MTPVLIALALTLSQTPPTIPDPEESEPTTSQPLPVTQESPLETLTRAPSVRPFIMPNMTPLAPIPYGALPDVILTQPVQVEQYQHSYEPTSDATQQYYERGVAGSYQAEQSLMGSLDGLWSLKDASGQPIYTFVLNDPPSGGGLEGAWRDLRRGSGPTSLGVIDLVTRDGQGLLVRFHDSERIEPTIVHLRPAAGGRWTGDLDDAGQKQTVTMARDGG